MKLTHVLVFGLILMMAPGLASAADSLGGIVVTKRGEQLSLACGSYGPNHVCSEILAEWFVPGNSTPTTWRAPFVTLDHQALKQIRKASRHAQAELTNAEYEGIGFAGTIIGTLGVCVLGRWAIPRPLCPAAILIGVGVDVVKAPVVLAFYGGNRLFDALTAGARGVGEIRFMLDSTQAGRVKKISEGHFESLAISLGGLGQLQELESK